jgi:prepilin-type N-terminal cleavage/methylation domain-containing protein
MTRLRRLLGRQSGYSLVELITVMAILGTILGGLTTAFVQGSAAELHANRRVQAQLEATAAFDRLRRDIHCAREATVTDAGATLSLSGCGTGSVSWRACSSDSGTGYALYRNATSCQPSGKLAGRLYADYLSLTGLARSVLFAYSTPVASLTKVVVDVRVNVPGADAVEAFELVDEIVLRNSVRA